MQLKKMIIVFLMDLIHFHYRHLHFLQFIAIKVLGITSLETIIDTSVRFFMQKSPHVHKSMLLNGAVLRPRVLNEMDVDLMRRHASTHDRIHNLGWQNRNSPRNGNGGSGYNRNGNSGYNNSRENQGYGNSGYGGQQGGQQGYGAQGYGNQPIKSFPPANAPGVPPSNAMASQWYEQTSVGQGNGGHNSGIMRLDDLQTHFGAAGGQPGFQNRAGYQNRGGYDDQNQGGYAGRGNQDRGYSRNDRGYGGDRGGSGDRSGSGYYQNQGYSGSGSGSAYRDNRRR